MYKFTNWFVDKAFDWLLSIHGPMRFCLQTALAFVNFNIELVNFETNFANFRNLEHFGKTFVKLTVTDFVFSRAFQVLLKLIFQFKHLSRTSRTCTNPVVYIFRFPCISRHGIC